MKNTPSLGPAPAPPAGWAPSVDDRSPRGVVLRAVRRAGAPVTVGEVAAVVGGHPNMARRHLDALVADGLVETGRRETGGRGRPAITYAAVPGAGAPGAGAPGVPDPAGAEYLALASAFADHLARGEDPSGEARAVGRAWGRSLAESDAVSERNGGPARGSADARGVLERGGVPAGAAEAPGERVLGLLNRLGFGPSRGEGGLVELRTCPLLDAARRHPEVMCEVHLGLVRGASAAYEGSGRGGSLVPFAAPGACHLRLPRD